MGAPNEKNPSKCIDTPNHSPFSLWLSWIPPDLSGQENNKKASIYAGLPVFIELSRMSLDYKMVGGAGIEPATTAV